MHAEGRKRYCDSQVEFDIAFGRAGQGTLEYALKVSIASRGDEYERIRDLSNSEPL